ncbi:MFS transporter [Gluconobacter morbifer]|uniref:L-galactonate transporter n=1 Tax=Gluconobacter morbifer G707 TaxID=1088869 RepID=G6XFE9_9PROT|nr:MFS transporter [Gluconobacter morbifer]EHH68907.1 L-galactonate transporter [Gluconobacter morbifer G707]
MMTGKTMTVTSRFRNVPSRYIFFFLVFLMYVISYGDRAALSIALPSLGKEFSLSPVQMGWVSSSFLWSYFLLNLPSTILLDRVGARRIGSLAVTVWSFAMMLGGMTHNIVQFLMMRVLLGVGEAPTFGVGATVVRNWALPRERGSVMTILLTGMQLGLAGGTIAGAYLIDLFGWRFEFVALGIIGLVWAAVWWQVYRAPPEKEATSSRTAFSFASVKNLFRSASFIGVLVVQCTQNYLTFLVMSWMPLYLIHELHIDITGTGNRTALCYLAASAGAVVIGRALEYLVFRKGIHPPRRRFIVAICLMGASTIGLLPSCHTMTPILLVLAGSLACLIAANGANTALLTDLVEEGDRIGTVTGVTLTCSNSLGLLAPIVTGYIVSYTGRFDMAWYTCSAALVVAGILSLLLVRNSISMRS